MLHIQILRRQCEGTTKFNVLMKLGMMIFQGIQSLIDVIKVYKQQMSQCIDYDDYKKMMSDNPPSPRRNLFQQNRQINKQLKQLTEVNEMLGEEVIKYKNICFSIVDAISRVYSPEVAEELISIIKSTGEDAYSQKLGETIYEVMAVHQSNPTVSDWSHQRSSLCTPEKSISEHNSQRSSNPRIIIYQSSIQSSTKKERSRSPFSELSKRIINEQKNNDDKSTSRSNNSHSQENNRIIATGILCEICEETFSPNQFIQHASFCKQPSFGFQSNNCSLSSSQLQDTHDRKLKIQSDNYLVMMQNLSNIQKQIEQQLKMLQFSKQKIDREAEKRKLEKQLAKVMLLIEQKKKKLGKNSTQKGKKKLMNNSKLRT